MPNNNFSILARPEVLELLSLTDHKDLCDPTVEFQGGCSVNQSPSKAGQSILDSIGPSTTMGFNVKKARVPVVFLGKPQRLLERGLDDDWIHEGEDQRH